FQFRQVANFALPYNERGPTKFSHVTYILDIPCHVAFDLCTPKFEIRLRQRSTVTVLVSVPKTTMDKDQFPKSRQDDIRSSREPFVIKSEAIPHSVQKRSNQSLRPRVLPTNAAHDPTSLLFGEDVRHGD